MRLVGLMVAASLLGGCVRTNPQFSEGTSGGDSTGAPDPSPGTSGPPPGTTSGTSGDPSSSSSWDPSDPTFPADTGGDPPDPIDEMCDAEWFGIHLDPPLPACGNAGNLRLADTFCARVGIADDGLSIHSAEGCAQGTCVGPDTPPWILSVDGVDLPAMFDTDDERCMWVSYFGYGTQDGSCDLEAVALWPSGGQMLVALGNGLPGLSGPQQGELVRPGGPEVGFGTEWGGENMCDAGIDCDDAGWRNFKFGEMGAYAEPDGEPVGAVVLEAPMSVFNFGLRMGDHCEEFGRWAVVPAGYEDVLD